MVDSNPSRDPIVNFMPYKKNNIVVHVSDIFGSNFIDFDNDGGESIIRVSLTEKKERIELVFDRKTLIDSLRSFT